MPREGLPTVRILTLDHDGNPTGAVLLDPTAALQVFESVRVALEQLGTLVDATGGASGGGANQFETEDGSVEIRWAPDGRFEFP